MAISPEWPPAPGGGLDADARWIWLPGPTGSNTYVEFECLLVGGKRDDEAWIQLSAETSFRLWINGHLIHGGPLREVAPYFYFDTIDLRPHLDREVNELRIVSHHQGQDSQSYQAGTPGLLVAGRCLTGNGLVHFSDPKSWRARKLDRYLGDAQRLFCCLGFSEHVDLTLEEKSWQEPVVVAAHPWSERPVALSRDIPAWREVVRSPVSQAGEKEGWLIDMGTEVSGYIELRLKSEHPASVRISYAEALLDGKVDPHKGGMDYFDRLEKGAGEVAWRSYEKRAFRYLRVEGPVSVTHLRVVEQVFPYEKSYLNLENYKANRVSEEGRLINRILDVSARTIELNTEDLLTDCPWRERAQYFDSLFYMGAMRRLFGTLDPVRRFLGQFPRGADATGLLRCCYPSPPGMTVIPDFSMSYALLLRLYLEKSGDLETVRKNLLLAERGVTSLQPYEDREGLLTDVPGWIFLDNTFELPKFPRSAALNAAYYGGHCSLAFLFRACGDDERACRFDRMADRIRTSFRRTFLKEGRLLDSDSTPAHESFRQWTYHYSAESGKWSGKSFRMRLDFRCEKPGDALRLAVHAGGRAWIDGIPAADIRQAASWTKSAIYEAVTLKTPADDQWHRLDLEVEWNGIDWECYLSSSHEVTWSKVRIWEEPEYGLCLPDSGMPSSAFESSLRRHHWPWLTQVTVGYAAFHGLLEDDEAAALLKKCLPDRYLFPFAKRTTPFFAEIGEIGEMEEGKRILPCNVPASMFYFCHALKKYGLAGEAKALLLPIYQGMLEQGATTWWEEWNSRSSLCHAWSSFVVEFLEE